ncbi:MAG: hypothetical protein IT370_18300 [Deltaproteobacteria bacterium]|nr:hypothetical protein [Deltaproteobacteria bacterium]
MNVKSLALAVALVATATAATGCKKKKAKESSTGPAASAVPGETQPVAASPGLPVVVPPAMDKLVASAAGWEGEYNANLQSWTFEKYTPGKDDMNEPNRMYVDALGDDKPADVDGYASKLTEANFEDFGFKWSEISAKTPVADGFVITGIVVATDDPAAKPEPAFLMVRSIGGASKIKCKSGTLTSDALRAEAIELCKSAKF